MKLIEASNSADVPAPSGALPVRLVADRSGERFDVCLARSLPNCSRAAAQRLIDAGMALVNGKVGRCAHKTAVGDVITVTIPQPAPSSLTPESMPLDIAYEDADLLVINKPSGIVVHPGPGHAAHTLVHALLAYCTDLSGIGGEQRPGIVHRLDRDTSGLLMVAKNDAAHAALSRQLQARSVSKYYLTVVEGEPRPQTGIVDAPIGRHPRDRQRMSVLSGGRAARTRYCMLGACGDGSLVVAHLETGRTHQLRVHFAALGCPIAGDPIYGNGGRASSMAARLWLHSWRLGFSRPSDGRRIVVEAPLPPELADTCPHVLRGNADGRLEPLEGCLRRARRWADETDRHMSPS